MRHALIDEAGTVVNVALLDSAAPIDAPEGHVWREAPDHIGPGWRLVANEFQPALAPAPTASDVRAEASRRMQVLVGARDADHLAIMISNGVREAVRLLNVKQTRAWTQDESARAAQLAAAEAAIDAIRTASNAMEADPPADYRAANRWPA